MKKHITDNESLRSFFSYVSKIVLIIPIFIVVISLFFKFNQPKTDTIAQNHNVETPKLGVSTNADDAISRVIAHKMSKSNPDSAIFMTDTTEDIKRKINKAYCLEGDIKENPILEYCKYIIFESFDRLNITEFVVERPEKWGGNVILNSFQDLETKFVNKEIHPQDLKIAVVKYLDQLLQPVRKHFEENMEAKKLLETVKSYQVTR